MCSFVGETDWHIFKQNVVCWLICALHQWVGEIDPWFDGCVNLQRIRSDFDAFGNAFVTKLQKSRRLKSKMKKVGFYLQKTKSQSYK